MRTVTLLLLTLATTLAAQSPQDKIAAIKEKIAANQQAIRKYQWIQTMTMAVDGSVKQTTVSSCNYQAGQPKPVCTEISSTPAEKPSGGPLKRKMIEDKIAQMKAYMDSVKTLMAEYIPLQPPKIEAARQAGNVAVAPDPATQSTALVISNYAEQGDKITLSIGDATMLPKALAVATWLNSPSRVVTLNVAFQQLGDGTNYAATRTLDATAEKIVVTLTSTQFSINPGAN